MSHTLNFRALNLIRIYLTLAVLVLASPTLLKGQASTKSSMTPGTPAGSYKLGDADTVNLFTGNLNYTLPLLEVGGRGEARAALGVVIEAQTDYQETDLGNGWLQHAYSYRAPNALAFVGHVTWDVSAVQTTTSCGSGNFYTTYRASMVYVEPDGTEHALRDQSTHGMPVNGCVTGNNVGRVFESTSGDFVTFVSDATMYTNCYGVSGCSQTATGYLYFRNGAKSRVSDGRILWTQDRNGNKIEYGYGSSQYPYRLTSVTDSLGRTVQIEYDVTLSAPYGRCTRITYKGFGNQDRVILISREYDLTNVLRATQTWDSIRSPIETNDPNDSIQLGGGTSSAADFVKAIWLPNGQSYQFKYNIFGQLARVDLPTGGAIEYDFADLFHIPFDPVPSDQGPLTNQVSEKRVYGANGALLSRTKFSNPTSYTSGVIPSNRGGVVRDVEILDPSGNRQAKSRHYFFGVPNTNYGLLVPWWQGKEFRNEAFALDGTTMLRINENVWGQRSPSWCSSVWPCSSNPAEQAPTNNPFVVETKSTLVDGNLVSKVSAVNPSNGTWAFDTYNNQTDVWEYGYGSGQPGSLIKHTQMSFINNANLTGGLYLLGLPSTTTVSSVNSSGQETQVSASQTLYDEYSSYPLFTYGSVTGWQDPGSVRGNPTTVKQWLDTSQSWIETHARFDQLGNARQSWDALGRLSQTVYDDAFSDSVNRNTFAFPTQSYSPVPDSSGIYGSTASFVSSSVYDYSSGKVTSSTDINAKVTTLEYSDPLDRLTKVNSPDGGRTTYNYVDAHQCGPYVQTLTRLDSSRDAISYQFFDGLGRVYRTFAYENQDATQQYLTVDTQYDAMGRAWRVSSPYRSTGCTADINPSGRWTESTFDGLGRTRQVRTTADNAALTTDYSGNTVTVTDAHNSGTAGRSRMSVTDALGRVTDVYEDPNGVNYLTHYTYDVLGNLRAVAQDAPASSQYPNGVQQRRYFMYDSLGRLIRSKNPEQDAGSVVSNMTDSVTGNSQWSMGYGYDVGGNMTVRIDARNVQTTYAYDALNRPITVRYTDGTKDIDRHYDNPTAGQNGAGRFWYSNYELNNNTRFDTLLAIDGYDAVGRPLNYRQHFYTNGVASPKYNVTRTYDYAGNVLTQTYPSGHTVSYAYDIVGRINTYAGNLGDGVSRNYSTGISYSEFGGLQQEQFGTQTALYRKQHYNVRGQLFDTRLSTNSLQANEWDWNRGALVNYFSSNYSWGGNSSGSGADNNGNLTLQQHFVPGDDAISTYTYTQDAYSYDSLNRLSSTNEVHGGPGWASGQDYVQTYAYDRFGNRTIDQGQTSTNIPHLNYSVDANTNRLVAPSGATYGYDAAGNQSNDTNSGGGSRSYDAENHLKQALENNVYQTYTYDADGRRIKRLVYGVETWQVYGMGGELLAEYKSGAAPFLPTKEYGYRGGELLVTMASGDDTRLARFVTNLYYGATQTDPTSAQLQAGVNQLAEAGALGYSQLLTAASQLARGLFTGTNYEASSRTDTQYVADLYYTYLQRAPDDSGLGWWAGQAAGNRANVCNAFEASSEFQTLVSTLYGTATSDNQRTEQLVNNFYLAAYGRAATSTEIQQQRDALNAAAAQGLAAVQGQVETMGRALFAAQVSDYSISDQQFVTNLYEGFLQRAPDAGGLGFWTSIAAGGSGNRQNVLNAFAPCGPARELAGTLYREEFWLVSDRLGTPRMIVDKSGSLAGVRRHDYLPFGEELQSGSPSAPGVGGRTTTQGYMSDSERQKFTSKERDNETGLDYFGARYLSSTQGRFTTPDPLYYTSSRPSDPQQFNLYAYVRNNPFAFVDPNGEDGYVVADSADALDTAEMNIKRMAPGTTIDANGRIHKPGFFRRVLNHLTGHGAGTALISRIADSKNVTLIHATDRNARPAGRPSSELTESFRQQSGCAAVKCDYYIEFNTKYNGKSHDRMPDGSIQAAPFDLAVALGHELIHADIFNHFGTAFVGDDDTAQHFYSEGGQTYEETRSAGEFLATGLPFTYTGSHNIPKTWDITENRLRKELMKPPRLRATYK